MTPHFLTRFPAQLGHWAIHGCVNALPSFLIAFFYLRLRNPASLLGMLAAVLVFVCAFAVVTSLPGCLSGRDHVIARSIRLGARIRSWIAGISLVLLPWGMNTLFYVPDFWCGFAAVMAQNAAFEALGMRDFMLRGDGSGDTMAFLPVFSTTLLEGAILSFALLMISFFYVILLQARERRKFLRTMNRPAAGA